MSTASVQIVTWYDYLPNEQNQDSFKKWLSLDLGQEMFKMSLEKPGKFCLTDNNTFIRDS